MGGTGLLSRCFGASTSAADEDEPPRTKTEASAARSRRPSSGLLLGPSTVNLQHDSRHAYSRAHTSMDQRQSTRHSTAHSPAEASGAFTKNKSTLHDVDHLKQKYRSSPSAVVLMALQPSSHPAPLGINTSHTTNTSSSGSLTFAGCDDTSWRATTLFVSMAYEALFR